MIDRPHWRRRPPTSLATVATLLLAVIPGSDAAQRLVVDARIESAHGSSAEEVDYIARASVGDRRQIAFSDPAGRVMSRLPARLRVTGELKKFLPGDIPLLEITHVSTGSWQEPSGGGQPRANPGLFAGADNGLYPLIYEPVPRVITGAGVTGGAQDDRDGDGVPDADDPFPDDPGEWVDTDGDGTGDNADPDDDGDSMDDRYEQDNGLDPLVDDSDDDLDGDGFTNVDESVAGTAADDARSAFRVMSATPSAGGSALVLEWPSVAGRIYNLYFSPDGGATPFFPIGDDIIGGENDTTETATIDIGVSTLGYIRIGVKRPP